MSNALLEKCRQQARFKSYAPKKFYKNGIILKGKRHNQPEFYDNTQLEINLLLKEQEKYLHCAKYGLPYHPKYKLDFVTNSVVRAR